MTNSPFGSQILDYGTPLPSARAAVVMLHGRGASASDMVNLARYLEQPGVAFLLPQASARTWYPHRFLAPLEENEPFLTQALDAVGSAVARCRMAGLRLDQIALAGFSQGACLALEYAARHPTHYGAVIGFSGALIGPLALERQVKGDLTHTPVFLGCSDIDYHIPLEHVKASAKTLRAMGARVDERIYPGMGHEVCEDELGAAKELVSGMLLRPA